MPPENRGMAIAGQRCTLVAMLCLLFLASTSSVSSQAQGETVDAVISEGHLELTTDVQLSEKQQELLDFAESRFESQGLSVPQIEIEFLPSTQDCDGHLGMYWHASKILRMCSMDKHTLLHEMAHTWANENLTAGDREAFIRHLGLATWNDHDHAWDQRGTEHAAETIAWALLDDPNHVKWVETLPDGTQQVSHRILTLDAEVETLMENFRMLTGKNPIFRDADEWAVEEGTSTAASPELARLRG